MSEPRKLADIVKDVPKEHAPELDAEHAARHGLADGDLGGLLDTLVHFTKRYVAFANKAQPVAVALWITHTHLLDSFQLSPYLAVTSPEKRSGKTRLLDVLALLVANPWRAVSPSEAVIFRKIQADAPTLLLDEVDTIFNVRAGNFEGLRALLNAGIQRGTTVPRCVGEGSKLKVQEFSIYCPKALAGIGELPDTVADRSIPIRLARRMASERVEKFRQKTAAEAAASIRAALEALDVSLPADPPVPDELNDRAADSWEPLLAIAEAAGGQWPKRAREAALKLSSDRSAEDESLPIQLLSDCRQVFTEHDTDRMPSKGLASALVEMPEGPWSDLYDGRQLTAGRLAKMLRPYGISSRQHRFGEKTLKGYECTDFADAWSRYVPSKETPASPLNVIPKETSETPQVTGLNDENGKETPQVEGLQGDKPLTCNVSDGENVNKPLTCNVSDVSFRNAFTGTGTENESIAELVQTAFPGAEYVGSEDIFTSILRSTHARIATYWEDLTRPEPTAHVAAWLSSLENRLDMAARGVATPSEFEEMCGLYEHVQTRVLAREVSDA